MNFRDDFDKDPAGMGLIFGAALMGLVVLWLWHVGALA